MSEVKRIAGEVEREWTLADLAPVLDALQGLRSRLMQIDRREKIRSFRK
jgi:hypothetical protein